MHNVVLPEDKIMKVYHTDVFVPEAIRQANKLLHLRWTTHAKDRAMDHAEKFRRFRVEVPLISHLDTSKAKLIEAEVDDSGRLVKRVWRIPGEKADICLAVMENGVVKTVWVNLHTDNHKTLDTTKYAKY